MILGAVEAGGTKFVCAVGDENGNIHERIEFPTTTPDETMDLVINFFKDKNIETMGIGCFGPICLNKKSSDYGCITTTPKLLWQNYNIVKKIKDNFNIPIGFDTDVNAAALGEATWGAAKGLNSCLYMTVGTGIGAGLISEGKLVHGLLHPEMGHMLIPRDDKDTFEGNCPFHKNCLEGMASGPAIEKRWNKKPSELSQEYIAWEIEAHYLAVGLMNIILVACPEKIILGGGVMKQKQLFPLIRKKVKEKLNGYLNINEILNDIDNYIVYPKLEDNAGICGALALALNEIKK